MNGGDIIAIILILVGFSIFLWGLFELYRSTLLGDNFVWWLIFGGTISIIVGIFILLIAGSRSSKDFIEK